MISVTVPLNQGGQLIDQPWIYIILLGIGGILFFIQMKYMFFPTWKGKILEFEDLSADSCDSCKSTKKGRSSIEVKVKTDDGEIITAEVGCCNICLNKLQIGSRIGVSKIGSRIIAQPLINLSRGNNW